MIVAGRSAGKPVKKGRWSWGFGSKATSGKDRTDEETVFDLSCHPRGSIAGPNYIKNQDFNDVTDSLLGLCNRGHFRIILERVDALGAEKQGPLIRLMRIACEIACPGVELVPDPDNGEIT